ncbi:Anti-sigma-K factor RskA [Faunimonas pinastri]|uniref:Regulator of SigK n=1 Tax=Faunimonas pinastri TaxID=1855383 RepID=A0A1H9MGF1_9HYPH|nr:anti-sigma factor [Faunimonas pinastri]SER22547.1 Anti-sigma-K factor RskA [Faunimonas pinastri]
MNEELEQLAGEYVIGTLPGAERQAFAARLGTDADARDAVQRWERRLAPLAALVPESTPPATLWAAISSRVGQPAAGGTVVSFDQAVEELRDRYRRRLAFWRRATIGSGAIAAGLAGLLVINLSLLRPPPAPAAARYVAVVNSTGEEPALIVEADTGTGQIRVRSVTAAIPSGKSLELWHIEGSSAPRSMGVIQTGDQPQVMPMPVSFQQGAGQNLFAVSVEPTGGSPTGAPTGPVVYKGTLIRTE